MRPFWLCTMAFMLWHFVTSLGYGIASYSGSLNAFAETMTVIKVRHPASDNNSRIIIFVDDLDRCQTAVILQVLSAINLVLGVCKHNVALTIYRGITGRAVLRKYAYKANKSQKANIELAKKYMQKLKLLLLDLPDPSEDQLLRLLERQLGVFKEQSKEEEEEDSGEAQVDLSWDTSMTGNQMTVLQCQALAYFLKLTTNERKLPREWKGLLSCHNLVLSIFFLSNETVHLAGRKVQLITWIFISWE